jgi:fatty acid synthase, animal type
LLKRNIKEKVNNGISDESQLPRLVLWSGRTEDAVNEIFGDIIQRPLDIEHIALLQNSQSETTLGNSCRGFGIFKQDDATNKAVNIQKNTQTFSGSRRPIVWVFTGMGSQWSGMYSDLKNISTFAESIEKSHKTLLQKGVNLKAVLTTSEKKTFENVLNSYVGIIAIEIALVDVLKSLGLTPDYIIGHSVGELGCAYADGCFTAEETILVAYFRGLVGIETNSIKGAMAAVGLHHSQVSKMLPDDIDIACHNASNSTTISGPVESIKAFVEKLNDQKIFARKVESSGVAFHSRYIVEMGKKFHQLLQDFIVNPKRRSSKWLSSSFPICKWDDVKCQFSSADYHAQNLLNPVLFEEVCKKLPENSLTIEIGPHGLLKSILKQNIKNGLNFNLMQRENEKGSLFLMESLGR